MQKPTKIVIETQHMENLVWCSYQWLTKGCSLHHVSRRGLEGSGQSVYWSTRKKCLKVLKFSCKAKGKLNELEIMKFYVCSTCCHREVTNVTLLSTSFYYSKMVFNLWMHIAQKWVIVINVMGKVLNVPPPKIISKSIPSHVVFEKNEKEWSEFNSQTILELMTGRGLRHVYVRYRL